MNNREENLKKINVEIEMLSLDELEKVSGGMTGQEYDQYVHHYDIAILKAYKSGNMELYNKLVDEFPFKEYRYQAQITLFDKTLDLDEEGNLKGTPAPYLNMKVEDLPNYELIMQIVNTKN